MAPKAPSLSTQLKSAQAESKAKDDTISSLTQRLVTANANYLKLSARQEAPEATPNATLPSLVSLNYSSLCNQLKSSQAESKAKDDTISSLKQRLATANANYLELSARQEALKATPNTTPSTQATLQAEADQYKADYNWLRAQHVVSEELVATLRSAHAINLTTIQRLTAQATTADTNIATLTSQLQTAQAHIEALTNEATAPATPAEIQPSDDQDKSSQATPIAANAIAALVSAELQKLLLPTIMSERETKLSTELRELSERLCCIERTLSSPTPVPSSAIAADAGTWADKLAGRPSKAAATVKAERPTAEAILLRQQISFRPSTLSRAVIRVAPLAADHPLRAPNLDTAKILEKAQRSERMGAVPLAINRLPSGDLAIQVTSAAEAKQIREADAGWIKDVVGSYGEELPKVADPLHAQRHTVVLHRVGTGHSLDSIQDEIERTCSAPARELQWLAGTKRRQHAAYSSILVKLSAAEDCAKLIQAGAVGIHNAVCRVAPYQPQERVVHCSNCQRHNHPARFCKSPTPRCRTCKGHHHTSKHPACSSCGCNDGTCKHARLAHNSASWRSSNTHILATRSRNLH